MTFTEELPTQQATIITKQCSNGGWIACIADDPCKWDWGCSEAESIGKLHISHQDVFGPIQRQEPE